jgi:hypothetical protein
MYNLDVVILKCTRLIYVNRIKTVSNFNLKILKYGLFLTSMCTSHLIYVLWSLWTSNWMKNK